jgi:hypothetical protein
MDRVASVGCPIMVVGVSCYAAAALIYLAVPRQPAVAGRAVASRRERQNHVILMALVCLFKQSLKGARIRQSRPPEGAGADRRCSTAACFLQAPAVLR